ncbi:MAG: hypothetical protein M0Z48_00545 [Nitrospiraceae bacterium]|nr:hypothetical protein [Nitrospiraceae bacterium]
MTDPKGKAIRANIEMAFGVYCLLGGNVSKTLVELAKRGLKLSRPTMDKWIKDYRFAERMQSADAERQRANDSQLSFEQAMMSKLVAQIEKYEMYLESAPGIDNQATYAYTNLLKTVVELSRKVKVKEDKNPEALKQAADEILESEYGIKR